MDLFLSLLFVVNQLRPAFARQVTFHWFVIAIMGFCMREDSMGGVSSFVRTLSLNPKCYQRLLHFFQTHSVDLERLTQLWVSVVFKIFKAKTITFNGRPILVIDGISISKEGKKMAGVQRLHQSSESNSKPKFIMGHFFQSVGLLVGDPSNTIFCVPLFARIHLGTKTTNRDKKTLYDKAVNMLEFVPKETPYYLVADAYYSTRKILSGVTKSGSHIISRVKSNAVAYFPVESKQNHKRGRPQKYGQKIKLKNLFADLTCFTEMDSPTYGEKDVTIMVRSINLLSRSLYGMQLQYVLVIHPTRGKIILLSSDLSLDPLDVIRIYSYRFKIEVTFKSAIYNVGAFLYRFWSPTLDKTRRGTGTTYLHKKGKQYRLTYLNKLRSYEVFVQVAFIAQGILQYISLTQNKVVWSKFGSWIRTIRPNVLPTEMVVAKALRNQHIDFLQGNGKASNLQKFIRKKVQIQNFKGYYMTR